MSSVTSLYIHVPFCRHLCNYCDFYKQKFERPSAQREEFSQYMVGSLKRHESILSENHYSWAPLETLYLGGGTASLWDVEGARCFASLGLRLAENCEATLEVDPGAWSEEGLQAWQRLGINRYSIGTQSFDPHHLRLLDRAHSLDDTKVLLERLKGENFSVDFLLGAPEKNQNRDVIGELELLLRYAPKHLSLYILQPAAGYKLKSLIPDDEITSREYLRVSEFLQARGFHHYEVSNFALPGFESRHNQRYWESKSVAALGPTGVGYLAQEQSAFRYKWKPSSPEVEVEVLSSREIGLEQLYLRLRTSQPITAQRLSIEPQAFQRRAEKWQARGLCEPVGGGWRMKPEAWVILDSLVEDLLDIMI
jgi:oxygen-independent coproporphyrinogen-3 oxidase